VRFDQQTGKSDRVKIDTTLIWLRADSDSLKDKSGFSYSLDGNTIVQLGGSLIQPHQLTAFQGIRNTLFAYNTRGAAGGYADFDSFSAHEPHPHELTRPIPCGRTVRLVSAGLATGVKATHLVKAGKPFAFRVVDVGFGRVAFRSGKRVPSVRSNERAAMVRRTPGKNESFQWMEAPSGELALASLGPTFDLRVNKSNGSVTADSPGPQPGGQDGMRLVWEETK
jgi:hypothetical protein